MLSTITWHTAAAPAANSAFISQYGPLLAALVALFGVLITLAVNVRRDQARYRSQREDEYRRDQRNAIAAIAVAGHNFRKECAALVDHDNQIRRGRDLVDPAKMTLLNELTVARLLIQDPILRCGLDEMNSAWTALADALDKKEEAFLNRELRSEADESMMEALRKFDAATKILYTAAMRRLKPTVAGIGHRLQAPYFRFHQVERVPITPVIISVRGTLRTFPTTVTGNPDR